jgi:ribose 5-phosphate isomerase B
MKNNPKGIAVAADHGGFRLKEKIKSYLTQKGFQVKDFGTYSEERCDYPDYAYPAAKGVSEGRFKRAVILCKSGIGDSIVANRVPGVRAALCYNVKAARLSREHNDSNVLVLGSIFVNEAQAKKILDVWLKTKFSGGRHKKRLDKIRKIERQLLKCR